MSRLLPDELLACLDPQATEQGVRRSATLCDLAEAALGERERLFAERMAELEGHAAPMVATSSATSGPGGPVDLS